MGITKKCNDPQSVLLKLLAHNLFSVPFEVPGDVDWAAVLKESKLQAVSPIAFKEYKQLPIDPETAEEIRKTVMAYTISNIRCFKNHAYLHALMSKANISYCMMKGVVSAHYYPEPLLRNMGDVDFYVHPKDMERATALLIDDGFEKKAQNISCHHIAFKKKNFYCEMHYEIPGMPNGDVGEIIGEYRKDLCENSHLVFDELAEFREPSAFHHGLIMLMHIQNHLLAEGIGLRHLCDWAVFVNSFSEEAFTEMFEEKLKRVGLWNMAKILSLASVECLGMPYQEWMGKDMETASDLIVDIIAGGNFGRKVPKRKFEGMFIFDGGQHNRVYQFFRFLNQLVNKHWKFAKKFPLIYPVGWFYFSVRYFIRMLFGKRMSINIVDAFKQSKPRREIYSKLKLYEPEE